LQTSLYAQLHVIDSSKILTTAESTCHANKHPFINALEKGFTPPDLRRDLFLRTTTIYMIRNTMATRTAPSNACATCGQPATTRFAGCADTEHIGTQGATLHCSKECQTNHWDKHKTACLSAQGRKKLFRAAELIQEIFLALKSETIDVNVTKV
jgi:hypothetical protein